MLLVKGVSKRMLFHSRYTTCRTYITRIKILEGRPIRTYFNAFYFREHVP